MSVVSFAGKSDLVCSVFCVPHTPVAAVITGDSGGALASDSGSRGHHRKRHLDVVGPERRVACQHRRGGHVAKRPRRLQEKVAYTGAQVPGCALIGPRRSLEGRILLGDRSSAIGSASRAVMLQTVVQ